MKNKIKWIGVVLAAMLIFGLSGCDEPKGTTTKKSNAAILTAISFGAKNTDTVEVEIKDPIAFEDYAPGNVFPADKIGSIIVKNTAALGKEVNLTISAKANALMVRGSSNAAGTTIDGGNYPPTDDTIQTNGAKNGAVIPSVASGNHIVVMVTSEDLKKVNYYIFRVTEQGSVSTLNSFTFSVGGSVVSASISPGTPSTGAPTEVSWSNVTRGSLGLTNAQKTGVFNASASSGVDQFLTKEFAIGEGDTVPTAFSPSLESREYKDMELIYIRVTSQNGESQSLYIIEVQLGREARLLNVKFTAGDENIDTAILGTPNADIALVVAGEFEAGRPQPVTGFGFVPTMRDPAATAKWAVGKGTVVPTSFDTTSPIVFVKGDFLYVEVTSANGKIKLYYKMQILLVEETIIVYGQPKIRDAGKRDYIDPLWDNVEHEILDVSRVNSAEMTATYSFLNPVNPAKSGNTTAWAKTMWDDEGLYVYVNVDLWDYYKDSTDKNATPPVPTTRIVTVGTNHLCDNVEIFVNERLQQFTSGDYGNQFRIGPPSTSQQASNYGAISGRAAGGSGTAITDFEASKQFSSWIRLVDGKQVGYTVIAKVPWTFVSSAQANNVFDADGMVKTVGKDQGPTIGMELQLNVSLSSGNRVAILTWNGIRSQAYANVQSYGRATLVMGEGSRKPPAAAAPVITTQPADRGFTIAQLADTAYTGSLLVAATTTGGTLSYQWYEAADDETATEGTLISGATAATFKPAASTTKGTYYYYVIVTNTRGSGEDATTATTRSRTATVHITTVETPIITTHPVGRDYIVDAAAVVPLTVAAAAVSDGGTLSYQWWSTTLDVHDDGEEIDTATAASYTPDITEVGTTWYWVVVTNTLGAEEESTASRKAEIIVHPTGTVLDYEVDLTGQATSNTTAWTSNYNNGLIWDVRKDGQPVSRDLYDRYTMVIEFYQDAELTEKISAAPSSALQMKWWPTVVTSANDGGAYGDTYNLGTNPSIYSNAPLLGGPTSSIVCIGIQTGGAGGGVPFIKLISITFHVKEDTGEPPPPRATVDLDVAGSKVGDTNATNWTAAYQTLGTYNITFPEGINLRGYTGYTVRCKAFDAEGNDITATFDGEKNSTTGGSGWGVGQVVFLAGGASVGTQYNLNVQTTNAAFPTISGGDGVAATVNAIMIQNSNALVAKLELESIILHADW